MSRGSHAYDRTITRLTTRSIVVLCAISGGVRAADGAPKESGPYCGLYCAYGALQAIGKDVPFESLLRPRYISSRQGSSIMELREAVIDAGAYAVALQGLGAESLRAARRPMVLHLASEGQLKSYNHWVLFCGMQNGQARLLDAPQPMETVPLADLLARWNGTALVVSDRPNGLTSAAVGARASHLSVILSALLVVYLLDYVLRSQRWRYVGGAGGPMRSRVSLALRQATALTCCSLVLVGALHGIEDVGFLRNPAAARYVAAAKVARFFPKLTYSEARRFLDERRGTIIDARFPMDYQGGHVRGAVNVPIDAPSAERQERLKGVRHDVPLLIYCQSSRCAYGELVATLLARDGFESISIYPGGWLEWQANGQTNRGDRE